MRHLAQWGSLAADFADYPARLRPQPKHPERMKVNSRGRAALREAHGSMEKNPRPLKGSNKQAVRPFQGSDHMIANVRGLRAEPARPRLFTSVPSGPRKNSLQKQKLLGLLHRLLDCLGAFFKSVFCGCPFALLPQGSCSRCVRVPRVAE